MKIYINGNAVEITSSTKPIDIDWVISKVLPTSQQQQSFALALNGDFVGRDDYRKTYVNHNDSIDLLFPIVGG